ncbi:MAG: FABP family protein [Chloroflexi bacterium]|nr:FABP family protein [Chloroflexota bacterium]
MSSPTAPDLPPALAPLAFLIGSWRGQGQGMWNPTNPFRYREEVQFVAPPGKPFLFYTQRTWALDDGRAMHVEAGYLRPGDGRTVEFVLAQPTGLTEVQAGTLAGQRLTLRAATVGRAPTALNVTGIARELWREGDVLRYLVRMAMNDEPLADHLTADLQRVP